MVPGLFYWIFCRGLNFYIILLLYNCMLVCDDALRSLVIDIEQGLQWQKRESSVKFNKNNQLVT